MSSGAGAKCDAHALGIGTGPGYGPPQSSAPCGSPLERQSQSTEGRQAESQRVRGVCASKFCVHACRSPLHVSATFERVTCCSCCSIPCREAQVGITQNLALHRDFRLILQPHWSYLLSLTTTHGISVNCFLFSY